MPVLSGPVHCQEQPAETYQDNTQQYRPVRRISVTNTNIVFCEKIINLIYISWIKNLDDFLFFFFYLYILQYYIIHYLIHDRLETEFLAQFLLVWLVSGLQCLDEILCYERVRLADERQKKDKVGHGNDPVVCVVEWIRGCWAQHVVQVDSSQQP